MLKRLHVAVLIAFFSFIASWSMANAGASADEPTLLMHEEAVKRFVELRDAGEATRTKSVEVTPLNDAEVLALATSIVDDPANQSRFAENVKDDYLLVKKTVGLEWIHSNSTETRCAKIQQLVVGQKRFVAWMPVCYRWRLYSDPNRCKYVIGQDPGAPASILLDQVSVPASVPGISSDRSNEVVAIKTTDFVCISD